MDNATGKIGILYIRTLEPDARAFIDGYMANGDGYHVTFGTYTVDFIKWEVNLKTALNFDGKEFSFKIPASAKIVSFDLFTGEPIDGTLESYTASAGTMYGFNFIGYNPFIKAGFNTDNYDYIWKPVNDSEDGAYSIHFNDDEPKNDGIIEWLKNFWDSLLKFFKDLFVPPEGYFENWFKEIQDAFMKKMGGLGELFEYIKTSFEKLKDSEHKQSSIKLELPKDFLYKGYEGISADVFNVHIAPMLKWLRGVLTAMVIAFTSILCIRKVIALVKS